MLQMVFGSSKQILLKLEEVFAFCCNAKKLFNFIKAMDFLNQSWTLNINVKTPLNLTSSHEEEKCDYYALKTYQWEPSFSLETIFLLEYFSGQPIFFRHAIFPRFGNPLLFILVWIFISHILYTNIYTKLDLSLWLSTINQLYSSLCSASQLCFFL